MNNTSANAFARLRAARSLLDWFKNLIALASLIGGLSACESITGVDYQRIKHRHEPTESAAAVARTLDDDAGADDVEDRPRKQVKKAERN
jgi:hypothetical protein